MNFEFLIAEKKLPVYFHDFTPILLINSNLFPNTNFGFSSVVMLIYN